MMLQEQREMALPIHTLIMAGGIGRRLGHLTEHLPKPMLPINGRPLLEWIILHLRHSGLQSFTIATHYRSQSIRDYFGDGSALKIKLDYVHEERPLGTAGALRMLDAAGKTLLVLNGDILTTLNIQAMYAHHLQQQATLTMAVRELTLDLPYGVVEAYGNRVQHMREKPKLTMMVNAGIYLLDPSARYHLPGHERFDMTDLIQRVIAAGKPVFQFPFHDYWLDIGQPAEYAKAQHDAPRLEASRGMIT